MIQQLSHRFMALCFLCNNLPVASPPRLFHQSSFVFTRPVYIHASLLPLCCTDPTLSGEEQPDPALLSEAGPAAAPRPGDEHRRTGSTHLCCTHLSVMFSSVYYVCTPLITLRRLSVSKVMERLCVRVQQQVCVLRGAGEMEEIQAAKQVLKEARNSRAVSGCEACERSICIAVAHNFLNAGFCFFFPPLPAVPFTL